MSLVLEEEVHQFVQVILIFNSKGLGGNRMVAQTPCQEPAPPLQGLSDPQLLRARGSACSQSPVAATAQRRGRST